MKNIVLGVTGSVAAIKTLALSQALSKFANLRLVFTQSAEYFVRADDEAFKELRIPCYRDEDEWPSLTNHYDLNQEILHIELRRWADCLLIAPLDANTLAKMTHGFCDNLLSSLIRAWDWSKPMVLSPAMNTEMWKNNPTGEQITTVKTWGAHVIGPIKKQLACKDFGLGAMSEVNDIADFVRKFLI